MSRRLRLLAECSGMILTTVMLLSGIIAFGKHDTTHAPIAQTNYENTYMVFTQSYKSPVSPAFSYENFGILQRPFNMSK